MCSMQHSMYERILVYQSRHGCIHAIIQEIEYRVIPSLLSNNKTVPENLLTKLFQILNP